MLAINNQHIPQLNSSVYIQNFNTNDYILIQEDLDFRLKINDNTYKLLSLINGKRNISDITSEFNTKFNKKITERIVKKTFYEDLSQYGVFEDNKTEIKEKLKPNYLKFSKILLKEKYFNPITNKLKFLIIPKVLVALFLLSLFILSYTSITQIQTLRELFSGEITINFTKFISLFVLSGIIHELGHASACKSFGTKHGGIGFGFYILTPALFVDVSDVWRLKPLERVIVNLSGIYFEMLFASVVIIISYIINNVEFSIIPAFIFARTLYNFNPFFRTDGYWVLSDATGIPNLRKESTKKVLHFFSHLKNGKKYFKTLRGKDIFLMLYALVSYSFILLFIVIILFYQPSSIITLPNDFYNLILELIKEGTNKTQLFFVNIGKFALPLIFYYFLFSLLLKSFKKLKITISRRAKY